MFRKLFKGKTQRTDLPPATKKVAPTDKVSVKAPGAGEKIPKLKVPERVAPAKSGTIRTPEEMCGIDPNTMSRETIRFILAALYKRHNNAASSLDPELRAEAREMLDAIVECRLRYFDC